MKKGVLLRVGAIGLVAMLFSGMSLNAENLINFQKTSKKSYCFLARATKIQGI